MPSTPSTAETKESASMHVSIPKGAKKLAGFEGLGVEQELTLHITGKVTSLSADGYGRSLSVTIDTLTVEADTSAISITEALNKSGRRGKA